MATFEDFLPEIKMRAYGVSDPVAEMYLRLAVIEFCERTRLWTRLVQEWAFEGDGRIVLSSLDEDNETLESVVPGYENQTIICSIAPAMVGVNMAAFAGLSFDGQPTGRPQYIFQLPDEVNTVGVWPIPDNQYSDIVFNIIIKPCPTATVFPDFLLQHHRAIIIEGALSKLKEIPGQTFTDPTQAAMALKRFENGKLNGSIDARRGRTVNGDISVAMRPFATGWKR